jgi:lipopolysaccharide export system permease protein
VNVIRAETGRIHSAQDDTRQFVELGNGISYSINETGAADRLTRFAQLIYYADAPATVDVENKRRAMPTAALILTETPKERAEVQWRFCLPVIALLMTLIAVELARTLPGGGSYVRFVAGIAIYMVVFNLAAVARTWLENGLVGAFPGMWWVPVLTAGLYVMLRQIPSVSMKRPG